MEFFKGYSQVIHKLSMSMVWGLQELESSNILVVSGLCIKNEREGLWEWGLMVDIHKLSTKGFY